jgi:hypothetical protein
VTARVAIRGGSKATFHTQVEVVRIDPHWRWDRNPRLARFATSLGLELIFQLHQEQTPHVQLQRSQTLHLALGRALRAPHCGVDYVTR